MILLKSVRGEGYDSQTFPADLSQRTNLMCFIHWSGSVNISHSTKGLQNNFIGTLKLMYWNFSMMHSHF